MKRFSRFIGAFLLLLVIGSGCHQNTASEDKIHIVCTIFPSYDWVRQILGDASADIDLTLLLDNSVDLHSYQPSVADIAQLSACDLFIYGGGESDAWVHDALKSAANNAMTVINLLDIIGDSAKEEEIIEGMEHVHAVVDPNNVKDRPLSEWKGEWVSIENWAPTYFPEYASGEAIAEAMSEHGHTSAGELDEHVWLSIKNAQIVCAAIADALASLDPARAALYQTNLNAYHEKLSALDAEYQAAVNTAGVKTLLFADRFPFRYLVDDYGLDYYAAFAGCSAETEASFETILFLARKIDELGLENIVVTESSDQSIAKTVKNNTTNKNQQINVLDSMQSVSSAAIAKGMTYLSIMESNLAALRDALN